MSGPKHVRYILPGVIDALLKRSDLPPPPTHCPCGNPAVLTRIEVYHPRGHTMIGAFGEFGEAKNNRGKQTLTLRPGYRYRRWIVECIPCMERDMYPERFAHV